MVQDMAILTMGDQ